MKDGTVKGLPAVAFFLFLLFAFSSAFSIAMAQMSLGLGVAAAMFWLLLARINPFGADLKWFYLAVAAFVAYRVAAALTTADPVSSISAVKEEWLFLAVPMGVLIFKTESGQKQLLCALSLGVILVAVYGLLQHFLGVHWYRPTPPLTYPGGGYYAQGFFSHPLTYGNYMAVAAMFLLGVGMNDYRPLSGVSRLLCLAGGVLAAVAVYLSFSRGALVSMVVALIILAALRGRRWLLGAIVVLSAGILVVVLTPGISERIGRNLERATSTVNPMGRPFIWSISLRLIQENPLFGVGPGRFKQAYAEKLPPDASERQKHAHAHNDVLNIAAGSGIPAAALYLAMWIAVALVLFRRRRGPPTGLRSDGITIGVLLGSLAFAVSSITEATFADEEVRQLLMLIWAFGLFNAYKRSRVEATIRETS